jgi:hypothetical protein
MMVGSLSTAPQKQISEFPFVIPAQAGIQEVIPDSGQKHAGMTACVNGHFAGQRCASDWDRSVE